MSRRRALLVGAATALVAAWVWSPSVAWAHASLVSSSPPDGASLAAAPAEVTLTFSDPMQPGAAIVVTGPDGRSVTTGDPEVVDDVVTQRLTPAGRGQYTIAYRATSRDGHPLTGQIRFGVGEAAQAAPAGVPSSSPSAAPAETSTSPPTDDVGGLPARDIWVPAALFAAAGVCLVLSRRESRRTT